MYRMITNYWITVALKDRMSEIDQTSRNVSIRKQRSQNRQFELLFINYNYTALLQSD